MVVLAAPVPIVTRIVAVMVVGYFAMIGMVALVSVALALFTGMARHEAIVLMSMIGFLAYAAIIIWGWTERSQQRVWCWLGAAALASHFGAVSLARLLPPIASGG